MKCRIKRTKKEESDNVRNVYYVKFLFFNKILSKNTLKNIKLPICHWVDDVEFAKIFTTKAKAKEEAKKYKLTNIEYERVE